jgi:phosphatidylglycerol:prolipoprotein diacylglycerol transferase
MFPVFQIGGLSVQSSGLILLAGLWIALTVVERMASRHKVDPNQIGDLTFYSLLAGLLGARLSYALRFPSVFAEHPMNLLSLNPGLLDPLGGVLVAVLIALILGQRKNMDFLNVLDTLSPGFAIMGVTVGLSHLAGGTAFGLPSNVPWAIELWDVKRHPSQIYTIISNLLILGLLVFRVSSAKLPKGISFTIFLGLSALARLFLDAFRGDDISIIFGLRYTQFWSWLILAFSLWQAQKLLFTSVKKS